MEKEILTKYQRQMMILSLEQSLRVCEEYEKNRIENSIKALEEGFSLEYLHGNLEDERSIEDCKLVFKILEMFKILKKSINLIQDTAPDDFDTEDLQNIQYYATFEGFDISSPDEGWMASYCCYIFDQNKYPELASDLDENDSCNSHSPMLNQYKTMLRKFDASKRDRHGLVSPQDIKRILNPRSAATSRNW